MAFTTHDALDEDVKTFDDRCELAFLEGNEQAIRNAGANLRTAIETRCMATDDRAYALRCLGLAVELLVLTLKCEGQPNRGIMLIDAARVEVEKCLIQAKWCAKLDWSVAHIKPERFA